jgi:hypothetical protein
MLSVVISKTGRWRPGFRERSAYQGDVLFYCPAGSFYDQMFTLPGMVFSCDNICPRWHLQAGNVCGSTLDSPPMLLLGGAPDFDLNRRDPGTVRHAQPCIASQPKRIDRIRNHGSANAKIIFGESIGYAVANVIKGLASPCPLADGLFDGVDSQVHSANLTRQFSADGRFAHPGQSAENDQHPSIIKDL